MRERKRKDERGIEGNDERRMGDEDECGRKWDRRIEEGRKGGERGGWRRRGKGKGGRMR